VKVKHAAWQRESACRAASCLVRGCYSSHETAGGRWHRRRFDVAGVMASCLQAAKHDTDKIPLASVGGDVVKYYLNSASAGREPPHSPDLSGTKEHE